MTATPRESRIRLVIFDLAGTTVDHGCLAPVAAFIGGFREFGIEISTEQARGPMGMEKRAHIRAVCQLEEVAAQWRRVHGRAPGEQDIDAMYRAFAPSLVQSLPAYSQPVPGLLPCLEKLERNGIKTAATTGYFREAADIVLDTVREQGFVPQADCCATEVPEGRPAPWMIYRCMEALGTYPPAAVVNVGDTPVDVASGRNAGVWSIGVTATGNTVGLAERELAALPATRRTELLARAESELRSAGAHTVVESVAELPEMLAMIEQRLAGRETPGAPVL